MRSKVGKRVCLLSAEPAFPLIGELNHVYNDQLVRRPAAVRSLRNSEAGSVQVTSRLSLARVQAT